MTACNTTVVPEARVLLAGPDTIHLSLTDGTTLTGFVFGSGSVLARIYNKSHQAT